MLHLVNPEPEGRRQKVNAFKDIRELPWWQMGLEIVGYAATVLVFVDFLVRGLLWLLSS